MEDIDMVLHRLQQKLVQLVKQNQLLQKQNATLKKESSLLRGTLNEKETQLQQLHQQIDVLRLSGNALIEDEKKLLEKRINLYLSDIEKCIALLNA